MERRNQVAGKVTVNLVSAEGEIAVSLAVNSKYGLQHVTEASDYKEKFHLFLQMLQKE